MKKILENRMIDQKLVFVKELHKPARRNYSRRKFDIRAIDETWQADLVEMNTYAKKIKTSNTS